MVDPGEPVPKGGGTYRVGSPYVVGGRVYVPRFDPHYRAVGLASWYGDDFYGRYTANGEIFDMNSVSAAHPTMPLPSYARVTNLDNGRSLIVRVNDRGPYRARPPHRPVDAGGEPFGLLPSRHRPGARRICRSCSPPGFRRPRAGGDPAGEPARAAPEYRQACRRPDFPPAPPPPASGEVLASASGRYPPPDPPAAQEITRSRRASMSYADPPAMDGTAQFLNGRGLY